MYVLRSSFLALALVAASTAALAQSQQGPASATSSARASGAKQLTPADLKGWKGIRTPVLSNDGKWFAYVLAPNEGDATVVIRPTADGGKELRFPIGEVPGPAGFNPFAAAAPSTLAISGDAKWVAFTIYPNQRDARRQRTARRPSHNKVAVVNLATGEKKEFDKVRKQTAFEDAKRSYKLNLPRKARRSPTKEM
jgi:hypothetical protein